MQTTYKSFQEKEIPWAQKIQRGFHHECMKVAILWLGMGFEG